LNPSIFKAYDIRGLYPEQLDEDAAYRIGVGFAQSGLVGSGGEVVVGRDMRESSETLFLALSQGLMDTGISVVDIGLVTTPMLYFAVNVLGAAGGVMITASHNPAAYNGFKLVREKAIPISGESGLETIRDLASSASFSGAGKKGTLRKEDVCARYCDFFSRRFSVHLDRTVMIDAGNGMAGAILPAVLEKQHIPYQGLFFELDGRFPHHEANPLKEENLQDLREAMLEDPGSIGIAFDGDGDRVAFLDEEGELISGDLLTALIARRLLEERGSGTIIYDLRSSRIVPEVALKTRVGHSFMKALMRKEEALFAGELSFHYYFADFFYCESGILAMLKVLEILAASGEPLSSVIEPFRKYSHSGEINFLVKDQAEAMGRAESCFSDGAISHLDGLSVDFEDWWFNLRPSNTEPLLRLNAEATTKELLHDKLAALRAILEEDGTCNTR